MLRGNGIPAGFRWVALAADDAHRSVYTEAFPLLTKYRMPMTVFAYPSAVSNASYAMTWEQLRKLLASGLCDVQSHTYGHPNFKKEREKLPAAEFDKLVRLQLSRSKHRDQGKAFELILNGASAIARRNIRHADQHY